MTARASTSLHSRHRRAFLSLGLAFVVIASSACAHVDEGRSPHRDRHRGLERDRYHGRHHGSATPGAAPGNTPGFSVGSV